MSDIFFLKCKIYIRFIGLSDQPCNVVWVAAQDGKIPLDAVEGGPVGNRRVYVVLLRTKEGNLVVGGLVNGSKISEVQYWGVRSSSTSEVLTNPQQMGNITWIKPDTKVVPKCALLAGYERYGEEYCKLYVVRTKLSPEEILPGKYNSPKDPL